MEIKIEQAKRLAKYAIIKMVIMKTLSIMMKRFELFDVDKITLFPTITETFYIIYNKKVMSVILIRSVWNTTYHSETFEILYLLYKLFNLRIAFGLKYCWFSLMKFLVKQVLVWVWNMYKNELPDLFINPSCIHTTLSLQQIDALEFEIAQIDTLEFNISDLILIRNIFVGMISEILNKNHILDLYDAIKQWVLH